MPKQHTNINVAILVDGGFFLKRYKSIFGHLNYTPAKAASAISNLAHEHLEDGNYLYRIFYYDCAPFDKKIHHPITKKVVDFKKSAEYQFRCELFEELKKKRKVALRLGTIKDNGSWGIYPIALEKLLKGKIKYDELTAKDLFYNMRQKGIDMKIGVDIASLAFKKLVHKIVLIAGDADFVPASKLARREGVDFVLDPMWNNVDASLFEHIDGLKSTIKRPKVVKQTKHAQAKSKHVPENEN